MSTSLRFSGKTSTMGQSGDECCDVTVGNENPISVLRVLNKRVGTDWTRGDGRSRVLSMEVRSSKSG